MASALLSPSVSRPSSPRNEPPPDLVSPDDGYDYNKIDTDPARTATKPAGEQVRDYSTRSNKFLSSSATKRERRSLMRTA